jgi:hypothetical protein
VEDEPETGHLTVSARSNRAELSFSFSIGDVVWTIHSNEEVRLVSIPPGEYQVTLLVPSGQQCNVQEGRQRTATVQAGKTTFVLYEIDCVRGTGQGRPRERDPE